VAPDIFFLNLYDMSMDDKVGSIIDANVRQIAAQKQEIARIEATGTQNNRQIEELKRQVAERQEQLSARLHVGTKLYDRLRRLALPRTQEGKKGRLCALINYMIIHG
jgi:S-adenosylmethionine:tRNA-ribosyltransferase-isomerase (queuine synthetase)